MAVMKRQKITSVGEDVDEMKPSCTVGENVNQYIVENSMRFLKKLKVELPYDPTKSLLGIYSKEMKTES